MRIPLSSRIDFLCSAWCWAAIVLLAGLFAALVVAAPAQLPPDAAGDATDPRDANAQNGTDVGASPLHGFGPGVDARDGAPGVNR